MKTFRTKLAPGGRIVVPAALRKAMGLEVGDEILLRLEGGEARLYTREQAIRRAQELVRRYVPEGESLADELLEERRREVEQEEAEAAESAAWQAKHKAAQ
jgi:AbrB family looped-hinge helix DNA binding protein